MCFNNTFWQCLRITAKPWFMDVISTLPVSCSFTGCCTVMAVVHFDGLGPKGKCQHLVPQTDAKDRQIRCVQNGFDHRHRIFPCCAGSPGPFDRKTPSGLWANTSSAVAVAGNTVTSHPAAPSNVKCCVLHRNLMQQLYVLDLFAAYIHLATPNAFHSNDNFARMSRPWRVKPSRPLNDSRLQPMHRCQSYRLDHGPTRNVVHPAF